MRLNVKNVPLEGVVFQEEISASTLDLETDLVKFSGPIKIRASLLRITNTLTIDVSLSARIVHLCTRCLDEKESDFLKSFRLCYDLTGRETFLDISEDLRQEIILGYPIVYLCRDDCRGICLKCGTNLNHGSCKCAG